MKNRVNYNFVNMALFLPIVFSSCAQSIKREAEIEGRCSQRIEMAYIKEGRDGEVSISKFEFGDLTSATRIMEDYYRTKTEWRGGAHDEAVVEAFRIAKDSRLLQLHADTGGSMHSESCSLTFDDCAQHYFVSFDPQAKEYPELDRFKTFIEIWRLLQDLLPSYLRNTCERTAPNTLPDSS